MLKTLPNIDLLDEAILENNGNSDLSIFSDSDIKNYREYINISLKEAYLLERNKLAELSEIEQAVLYFATDFRLMAIICALISLFLDWNSFGIGMFLFFFGKKDNR